MEIAYRNMRPNVDIPWSIHGKIKQYAQNQSITIEDAYIEALEKGTDQLPMSEDSSPEFSKESEWFPFGPRLIEAQGEESFHINRATTFFPGLYRGDQPTRFGTRRRDLSVEEFRSCLSTLQSTGYITRDWFTIHQLGGALVGRGLSNFSHAVETASERFNERDISQYSEGIVLYVADLPRESEYLILRGELLRDQKGIIGLSARFIADGYPVSDREYAKLASALGFDELFNARECNLPRAGYRFNEGAEVNVVDEVLKESGSDDEPWVSGLIIENPFQQYPDLVEHLEWNSSVDEGDRKEASNTTDTLPNYDHIYCELNNHHPVSDDREYDLNSVTVTYLSPLHRRNSIWNISAQVDW